MKTASTLREQEFWQALRKAIAIDDIEAANTLVAEQMEAWQAQLQLELEKLTHPGSTTIH